MAAENLELDFHCARARTHSEDDWEPLEFQL